MFGEEIAMEETNGVESVELSMLDEVMYHLLSAELEMCICLHIRQVLLLRRE